MTQLSATKLKWDPYFNQNRIEELIDTPEKAVSVVLENGRLNQVPPDRVVKWSFKENSVSKTVSIRPQLPGELLLIL